MKEAYWHVALDDAFSNLTTMITLFWAIQMEPPTFWVKSEQRDISKKARCALTGLKGVFAVADDVIVIGCGETEEES